MQLTPISAGYFKLDGGAMFGVVPKSIWNKTNPADEKNLCQWALRCLLIEDGDRLILVDTGIGNKQDQKFLGHYGITGPSLETSLAEAGFHPADITDVLLTHLHFDHCGGAVSGSGDQLTPTFPNARYWSSDRHWAWAMNPNAREKASFLKENLIPLRESGVLNLVAAPAAPQGDEPMNAIPSVSFLADIELRFAEGHTAAMMLPQIKYKNRQVVFMADLLPSTGHLPLPYVMGYDMFPLQTMREKKAFLLEAVNNDYVLFFGHDPVNECCTLQMTEKGPGVKEIFRLKDL